MTTFNEAFKAARKAKGAGATFTWNGKKYTTDYKEEVGKKAAPKTGAYSPRPKARPESMTKKEDAAALRAKADKLKAEAKRKADAVPLPKLGKLMDGGTTGNKPAVAPNRAEVFKKKK